MTLLPAHRIRREDELILDDGRRVQVLDVEYPDHEWLAMPLYVTFLDEDGVEGTQTYELSEQAEVVERDDERDHALREAEHWYRAADEYEARYGTRWAA